MIYNLTRNTILAKNEKICNNLLTQSIGLMFTLFPRVLVFVFEREKKHTFHMFFVFYSIDIVFLDKDFRVVELKENFKPFTFYSNSKPSKYVIELPIGSIKKSMTKINDEIKIDIDYKI